VIESFYRSHTDSYDFLIAFPAFPTSFRGEAVGMHNLIRNEVKGIGKPLGNNSIAFGAPSRLKAFIDVGSLIPGSIVPSVEDATAIVAHEVAHQWSGQVRFQSAPWLPPSGDLLGQDGAHWSFFLDSDASVLYGSEWRSSGNGGFTAVESRKRYSPLDLYLMGFLAAEEVPPATLLVPSVSTTFLPTDFPPPNGTQVQGSSRSVDVSEIIAAEGARDPAASQAQHEFRAAFILLVPNGQAASPAQLAFVDQVRRAWANDFFFMTRGRGVMETDMVEVAPAAVAANPAVDAGLNYLLGRQRAAGDWADAPTTALRETQEAISTLGYFAADPRTVGAVEKAYAVLQSAKSTGTDDSARLVLGVTAAARPIGFQWPLLAKLASSGLAPSPGYGPTVIDSALAATALWKAGVTDAPDARTALLVAANKDGGWPYLAGGPSGIEPTALIVDYLSQWRGVAATTPAVNGGLSFLQHRGLPDGTYADDVNSTAATARAVMALANWQALLPSSASGTAAALLGRQAPDGSWDESVLQTALALRALRVTLTPNLTVGAGDVAIARSAASDGEVLLASVTGHNTGYGPAPSFAVQAFDSAGLPFGAPVAVAGLGPGQQAGVVLSLDTKGHAGSRQLFVAVDPGGAIDELRKDDNRIAVPFAVELLPTQDAELVAVPGSLVIDPGAITRAGATITVTARVDNIGATDAVGVKVALLVQGVEAASASLDFPAKTSRVVTLAVQTPAVSGAVGVALVVDPDGRVIESRKDNNSLSALVPVKPTVDLAVVGLTTTPSLPHQGQDVRINFLVLNSGTIEADNTAVSIAVKDASGATLAMLPPQLANVAPGGTSQRTAVWRAKYSGTLTIEVRAENAAEDASTVGDNVVSQALAVSPVLLPNLTMEPSDLRTEPNPLLELKEGTFLATVRNVGAGGAGPLSVDFYLGDPANGGARLERAAVVGLAAGSAVTLSCRLAPASAASSIVTVVIDPESAVEEIDEADNTMVLPFRARSIPDLVLGDGDIQIANAFPRPGDVVPVTVSVLNAGEQDASQVQVTLFTGDPDLGGTFVAETVLPKVEGSRRATATLSWPTAAHGGTINLTALVNRARTIVESNYSNNRTTRQATLQDGALALSNPYFSPNGDGIKDDTEVYFRLKDPSPIYVEIRDRFGQLTRTQRREAATASGSLPWDGRDEHGKAAVDGTYALSVFAGTSAGGSPLGTIQATVDTNRSQVDDAFNTGLLTSKSLGGSIRVGGLAPLPDDSGIAFFGSETTPAGATRCGVYAAPAPFGEPVRRLTDLPCPSGTGEVAVSSDGTAIALLTIANYDPPRQELFELSIVDGAMRKIAEIPAADWYSFASQLSYSPGGQEITLASASGPAARLFAINRRSGSVRTIAQVPSAPLGAQEYHYSPDGVRISLLDKSGALSVLDTRSGEVRQLVGGGVIPVDYWMFLPEYADLLYGRWTTLNRYTAWNSTGDAIIYFGVARRYQETDASICGALTCNDGAPCLPPCRSYEAPGLYSVDVQTGERKALYVAPPLSLPWIRGVVASPVRGALAFGAPTPDSAIDNNWGAESYGLWSIEPSGAQPVAVRNISLDQVLQWSPQGAFILAGDHCNYGSCWYTMVGTLANMALRLDAQSRAGENAVRLVGTANDVNFDYYELGVRPYKSTEAFHVFARSTRAVKDWELGTWTPAMPGVFEIALIGHDAAGNTAVRTAVATWNEPAPHFSDLRADQTYISPNGDGVQDTVTFSYSANAPGNAEFELRNQLDDTLIQRFPRAIFERGLDAFIWDGRNGEGIAVPDGIYRLSGEEMILSVVVDNSPPTIDATVPFRHVVNDKVSEIAVPEVIPVGGVIDSSPFAINGGALDPLNLTAKDIFVKRRVTIADAILASWKEESSSVLDQAAFAQTGGGQDPLVDVTGYLPLKAFRGMRRWRAIDRAGNERVSAALSLPEVLFVAAAADADRVSPTFVPLYDRQPAPLNAKRVLLAMDTSVESPLVRYILEYRTGPSSSALGDEWIDGSADLAMRSELELEWRRPTNLNCYLPRITAIDERGRAFVAQSPMEVICKAPPGIGGGRTTSSCESATPTQSLEVKFKNYDGACIKSALIAFTPKSSQEPEAILEAAVLDCGNVKVATEKLKECQYELLIVASVHEPGVPDWKEYFAEDVNICRLSLVRGAVASGNLGLSLGETFREAPVSIDLYDAHDNPLGSLPGFSGLAQGLSVPIPGQMCGSPLYLHAVARFRDGSVVDAQPLLDDHTCSGWSAEMPCTVVAAAAWPVGAIPACGTFEPVYRIEVDARAASGVKIVSIEVSYAGNSGIAGNLVLTDVEYGPDNERARAHANFDASGLPDGRYSLTATARDSAGGKAVKVIDVQRVGMLGSGVVVDHRPGAATVTSPAANQIVCAALGEDSQGEATAGFDVAAVVESAHLAGYEVSYGLPGATKLVAKVASPAVGPAAIRARIDTTGDGSGKREVVVAARSEGGSAACSTPVAFTLSNGLHVGSSTIAPSLFSPDGDGTLDSARLSFNLDGDAEVAVSAIPAALRDDRSVVPLSLGGMPGQSGFNSFLWDGISAGGLVVADGDYLLSIDAVDACGHRAGAADIAVTVDTHPPVARIDSPGAGSLVVGGAAVVGEASDATFDGYVLSLGRPGDASSFVPLVTSSSPAAGILGAIPATALPGSYVLRLRVTDRVGHESSAESAVMVASSALMSSLSVTPPIVSPTGNGISKGGTASVGLLAPASLSFELLDHSGAVVRYLGSMTGAGPASNVFPIEPAMLAGLPDGDDVVRVTASASGGSEQATAPLVLDSTEPSIAITEPVAGQFVSGRLVVSGTIDDTHLTSWTLATEASSSATGNAKVSGLIASTAALADGPHQLRVNALDAAGNSREVDLPLTADSTPPRISFASPKDGAFVSGLGGPVPIVAALVELNPAEVKLERQPLPLPSALTVLFQGAPAAEGQALTAWDVATEVDGAFTLRLDALDKAGNKGASSIGVIVDNTVPVARLDVPAGGYLRGEGVLTGTAGDANLDRYVVEISDGTPALAFRFGTIGTGTTAVENGPLARFASLPADGDYTVRLTAVDKAGNRATSVIGVRVKTAPPLSPTALVAQKVAPRDVRLTWTQSPSPDVVGYQVYRASSIGALEVISRDLVTVTTYADPGLADGDYRYEVVALSDAGVASLPSNDATVTIHDPAPEAAITAPKPNAQVSGLVPIRGVAMAKQGLKEYRLSVGAGATPDRYTRIVRSTVEVLGGSLGTLDVSGAPEGSVQSLLLEVEDLAGNIAQATLQVMVHNTAPATPVLLSATAQGSTVVATWRLNAEPDVAGYLLYRNGAPVNAPVGTSLNDLSPYILPPTQSTYADSGVPDGTFSYQVQAINHAGVYSALSNALSVTLDNRAPAATIVQPAALARLAVLTDVLGYTPDLDVASVQFEIRVGSAATFAPLGVAVVSPPYHVTLDPSAFSAHVLELRAVARDLAGKVDPNPGSTFVFFDPPLAAVSATARVDGAAVTVDWVDPNPAGLVAAYALSRGGSAVSGDLPRLAGVATASSTQSGSPGAVFNTSGSWVSGAGNVQTWEAIFNRAQFVEQLWIRAGSYPSNADVLLRVDGVWVRIASGVSLPASASQGVGPAGALFVDGIRLVFTSAPAGRVSLSYVVPSGDVSSITHAPVVLSPGAGEHDFIATAKSKYGQAGPPSSASALVYAPTLDPVPAIVSTSPIHLTGGNAVANGIVQISRSGAVVVQATADAAGRFTVDVALLPGSNTLSAQVTDPAGNRSLPSAAVQVKHEQQPTLALALALDSVNGAEVALSWTASGDATGVARLVVKRTAAGGLESTIASTGPTTASYLDRGMSNGTYTYRVVPANADGLEGAPSNAVIATVYVPPPERPLNLAVAPLPEGAALRLSWSFAVPGDAFIVERALAAIGPFTVVNPHAPALATSFVDRGLSNGTRYYYRVFALDASRNHGAASAVAVGVPRDIVAPDAPQITQPTVPGTPITVSSIVASTSGTTELGSLVRLYQDGSFTGAVFANELAVSSSPLATTYPPVGAFDVSSDGTVVAYPYLSAGSTNAAVAVEVLASHAVTAFTSAQVSFAAPLALSPDLTRVVIQGGSGSSTHLYVGDIATGAFAPLVGAALGGEREGTWSPDSMRVAYAAVRAGVSYLGISTPGTGVEELVPLEPDATIVRPRWLPDGHSLLAIVQKTGGAALARIDLDTRRATIHLLDAQSVADVGVAPLGDRVAVVARDAAGMTDLYLVDIWGSGSPTRLTNDANLEAGPAFSPDGSALFFLEAGALAKLELATGATAAATKVGGGGRLFALSGGGAVLYDSTTSKASSLRILGRFTLPGLLLAPAANILFADSQDISGNASPNSAPIVIIVDTAALCDLTISAAIQPTVPIGSLPANALVTVTNLGAASAVDPQVSVSVLGSDGSIRSAPTVTLHGAAAPGQSLVGAVPLDIKGLAGPQRLYAVVDPAALIPESNRGNNTTTVPFSVTPTDAIGVVVAVNPPAAGIGGTATVQATVVNPGLAQNVTFHVALQSKDGAEVLAVGEAQPYLPLGAFSTASFGRTFQVGTQLADDYQVTVEGLSPTGEVLAAGKVPFVILPDRTTGLSLVASRASYLVGEDVEILSKVQNLSANAILAGAELKLHLVDVAGAVLREERATVPTLPLGEMSQGVTSLASSSLLPGDYRVVGGVWLGSTLLQTATAAVTIVNKPLVAGSLMIAGRGSPPAIPNGTAVEIDFRLQNVGSTAMTNLVGHLTVLDPDMLSTVSSMDIPIASLAAGAAYVGTDSIASTGLAQKGYMVSLTAEADGMAREIVASARFRIGDAVPPFIELLNVADGDFVQGTLTPRARIVDAAPGVALAEVSVDGAAPLAMALQDGSLQQGTWSGALSLAPDGTHVLVFGATDGDGNGPSVGSTTNPVRVSVISDTMPPVVTISGIDEGALTNADVTPVIASTDLHLASVRVELNGAAFEQGKTIVEDGDYLLLATATDKAMNITTVAWRFAVDKTPPRIVVAGITDGQVVPSGVVPEIHVSDAHLSGQTVSADGAPYVAGTVLAGNGSHTLDIAADDKAGNHSELHLRFTVDSVAPVISLTGFVEGEIASRVVSPGFVASDTDLAGIIGTLNQRPFESGTPVDADGDYELEVMAWDLAGNQRAKAGHFAIDRTPPAIAILGVVDGEVRAGNVAPVLSVTDAHLASVEAHYAIGTAGANIAFTSGDVLTADGDYTITVNAVDVAGLKSSASVRFAIDRTPPDIQITGVTDGEIRGAAVMPMVAVSDAHLGPVEATLTDGVSSSSFASGTVVSHERDYVLDVVATDRAGNKASRTIRFTIDLTPPAISISGVANNEVRAANVTPTFTVADAHPGTVAATLQTAGTPAAFTSGTTLTAETDYELDIHAVDAAGNGATSMVKFAIDRTAPQLAISGFPAGGCVAADAMPDVQVTDAHPGTLVVSLDDAPFTIGNSISTEGRHQLNASATDLAGNQGSASASLILDKTPPEIAITGIEEGVAYSTAPVATIAATDANLTRSESLLDGAPYVSGTAISARGSHVLSVETVDCAGNRANRILHFSVNEASFDFVVGPSSAGRALVALSCEEKRQAGEEQSDDVARVADAGQGAVQPECAPNPPKCTIPPVLGGALQSAGLGYDLAASESQFLSLMRTNRYRAYVAWGDRMAPSLTPRELREHVWEGVGLLFATDTPCQAVDLVDILGVRILGTLPRIEGANVLAIAPPGPLPLSGTAVRLSPGDAQALAVGSGDCRQAVVATLSTFGRGSALTIGFDPERAPSARMTEVIGAWLHAVASGPPLERVPLSIETVDLEAKNVGATSRDVRLTATPPQSALVLETTPKAATLSPPSWFLSLGPQERQSVSVSLGLSDDAGANTVLAELATKSDGTYVPYGERTVLLPVSRSASELLADAEAGLSTLALKGADDAHRRKALKALARLPEHSPSNRKQVEDRIDAVLVALGHVSQITSVNTDEVRLTLDALLRYWELRWTRLGQ
jgi:subtilase family serine protease